ncbi:hypothetical protein ACFLUX_00345 [Chloroflexota bacterium]
MPDKTAHGTSNDLDAIAIGVEAILDPFFTCREIVAQRTIEIAQQLHIAEGEVQQWAASRAKLESASRRIKVPESIIRVLI